MTKRRYSNFHRARKWHRKFRNALYDPNGVRTWLVDHYSGLYYKYYAVAEQQDFIKIGHRGSGCDGQLFIERHFGRGKVNE